MQRNTGLLCGIALPSWTALRWRLFTTESLRWDWKTNSKQEEEEVGAAFRLGGQLSDAFQRQSLQRKQLLKINLNKISPLLCTNIHLPSCMDSWGMRFSPLLTLKQMSSRLPRHRSSAGSRGSLACMCSKAEEPCGVPAEWHKLSAHGRISAAKTFVWFFTSLWPPCSSFALIPPLLCQQGLQ